ncbi:MAG TPA: DEAD/DEAH box helicase [Verrucomicrobiae bacterium]|jgi:ATP-dependent Lhr-like helicase
MKRFRFHPDIAKWFEQKFGSPTVPQERGWPAIQSGAHTLIAAPTGSGKTLAAFLAALDSLFRAGLDGTLKDEIYVLYVSPLKALSNDIHKNLEEPLAEIRAELKTATGIDVPVRSEVRTGDTPASKRQQIIRKPPHILVTTPESLYLLLTSKSGRAMLASVRTLIVDEIHAVIGNRRGSHLSLSMERLAALAAGPLQRIGLSATQKPIDEVARFLVGARNIEANGSPHCRIVDAGHLRKLDIAIELPGSPLEAVMSNEVWSEVYEKLVGLIESHRTTLVFVNTRRMAERVTHQLSNRIGQDKVTSHHGSLSTKLRLDAEDRLKRGELKVLVATSSLELGIDIGSVDLVCQLGTTRSIATLLQRVGRAEHKRGGLPKGRLFPLTRDELVECVATLQCVVAGELDRIIIQPRPLDVLAQQIVAAAASEDWEEKKLFDLARSAYPYRDLPRKDFDEVVTMLAEGFSTKRGRRGALIHHDAVNHRIRGRRAARLVALTSGGAIPDNGDYRVVMEPGDTFIGTVNEDFAVESMAGDIFQLGNTSWKITQVVAGTVRVADAQGQPPGMPFWLGEGPARTVELSRAVSNLRDKIQEIIEANNNSPQSLVQNGSIALGSAVVPTAVFGVPPKTFPVSNSASFGGPENVVELAGETPAKATETVALPSALSRLMAWFMETINIPEPGARQLADYFNAIYKALGVIPSQKKIVMERFFDESGGMQLVIHSPFGARLNRAWGLSLRKRFCRSFNFELQAAATDDAIVLSLGTQHSFPLQEVFHYLNSKTVRDVLVQALLDAPMFPIRWRWNATRSLALPRQRNGRKIPAPLQRMESENLLAAVFPDQLACLENIAGDREVPNHPLVNQTIEDCLTEAMDIEGLESLLRQIESGKLECIARDLPEPSPLAHEILNARPYAFLDDAPLEERRTQAVYTRRASESGGDGLGILDAAAIERVRVEAWPEARSADELHEALLLLGVMTEEELLSCVHENRAGSAVVPTAAFGVSPEALEPWNSSSDRASNDTGSQSAGRRLEATGTVALPLLRRAHSSSAQVFLESLAAEKRAGRMSGQPAFWVAAERLPLAQVVYPGRETEPALVPPQSESTKMWERSDALRELTRGRMEVIGPTTVAALSNFFDVPATEMEAAMLALEAEGFVLRGKFHPGAQELEWCDRRLLARIHRMTLNRLRAEIQPVTVENFQRYLLAWQRVDQEHRAEGPTGVETILDLFDGMELAAAAWEPEVLALRVKEYAPEWLDQLCLKGRVGWGRLTPPANTNGRAPIPIRSTPIAIFSRENLSYWQQFSSTDHPADFASDTDLVWKVLSRSGAVFFSDLVRESKALPSRVAQALAELVAQGQATSDSFEGLRALLLPADKRVPFIEADHHRRHKTVTSVEFAGRWSLIQKPPFALPEGNGRSIKISEETVEIFARVLLRRYGIVFRRLLERETLRVSWYELGRVYRRLEARGEIRGGHFINGVSGEQFAMPEAIGLLRSIRKAAPANELIVINAADPLNLLGILTDGPRVPAITANRILLRDGLPIAALVTGEIKKLSSASDLDDSVVERLLTVGKMAPALRRYYS